MYIIPMPTYIVVSILTWRKGGITHAFVMEFATAEDREYYVSSDPTHQEFVKSLGGIIEKAQVVDFANGVY